MHQSHTISKIPLLTGSRAQLFHTDGWDKSMEELRGHDWDVIHNEPTFLPGERVDQVGFDFLNNKEIYDFDWSLPSMNFVVHKGTVFKVAELPTLAIIRASHLWREKNFDKNMFYYFKENLYQHLPKEGGKGYQLFEDRWKISVKTFKQRTPTLNKTKEEFFDDPVVKVYDHDWIHEMVAYYNRPLFTKLQREGQDSVFCHKDKWEALSHKDKLRCIMEEAQVIAIERFMLANNWEYPPRLAYMKAIKKICTTLCSGYFRKYACLNYDELVYAFEPDRFDNIKQKIINATQNGTAKLYHKKRT